MMQALWAVMSDLDLTESCLLPHRTRLPYKAIVSSKPTSKDEINVSYS